MGPDSNAQVADSVVQSEPEFSGGMLSAPPGDQPSNQPTPQRQLHSRADEPGYRTSAGWSPVEARGGNLAFSNWLYRSRETSFLWFIVRMWLGYQWVNAGYQKIWGSERAAFWFGGGAGVKGFASAGVAGSTAGTGGASYGWWAAFLHDFVVPNASWIAKFISIGEILVGVALILGLFTGAAAFAGLLLNLTYMFTGSAGVNPMFMILEVPLILAWRNAGLIGLDRFVLAQAWTPHRLGGAVGRVAHRRRTVVAPAA
jgi:thiosulfate dehydrogenase [quinone] large subunit